MSIYNVSYDLRAPGRDYKDLYDEIKKLGSWARPVESTWLVDTKLSLTDVRSRIVAAMDSNDKLVITNCAKGTAWGNLPDDVVRWIKERL